jgi:uncharacterized protein YycO
MHSAAGVIHYMNSTNLTTARFGKNVMYIKASTVVYNGTSAIELLPVPIGAHCRHLPAAGS